MSQRRRSWIVVMVCAGVALWLGCGPQTPAKPKRKAAPAAEKKAPAEATPEQSPAKPVEEKTTPKPQAEEKEKPAEKAPEPAMPKEEKPIEKLPEPAKPIEAKPIEAKPIEAKPIEKAPEPELPKLEKPQEKPIAPEPPKVEKKVEAAPAEPPKPEKKPETAVPAPSSQLPVPAGVPKVVLGDADLTASLVKVGDKMPAADLPDVSGKSQSLQSLAGEKATLVVFWTSGNIAALQQLADLKNDILEPYGKEGVRVVVIATGEKADSVKDAVEKTNPNYPVLLDAEGSVLAKVASGRLPRTYVLDATGRVAWFDIGYSPVTREALLQSIRAILGKAEQ